MPIKNQLKDDVIVYGGIADFDIPCGETTVPSGVTGWQIEVSFAEESSSTTNLIPGINATITAEGRIQFQLTATQTKLLVDSKGAVLSSVFFGIWRRDVEQALGQYSVKVVQILIPE